VALSERRGAGVRCAVALLVVGLAFGCAKEERVDPTEAAFAELTKRIDDYVALRTRLADSVGPLDPTGTPAEIAARSSKLANAIIAARPNAKAGDIFTTEVATVIATLIKEEYSRRPPRVIEQRGDAQEELPDFVPQVDSLYPTTYPLATFPATLLPLLPRLPEQVEYRVVGRYLILRDVEANLIIDLMPNALPAVE
jgi:hypothetical protein